MAFIPYIIIIALSFTFKIEHNVILSVGTVLVRNFCALSVYFSSF
jgi:uncharacterized protein (DUF2062 family)